MIRFLKLLRRKIHYRVKYHRKVFRCHHTFLPNQTIVLNIEIQISEKPQEVEMFRLYDSQGYTYPLCPYCCRVLDREYTNYCEHCGQHLAWHRYDKGKLTIEQVDRNGNKMYHNLRHWPDEDTPPREIVEDIEESAVNSK